jgi:hypothetical protein
MATNWLSKSTRLQLPQRANAGKEETGKRIEQLNLPAKRQLHIATRCYFEARSLFASISLFAFQLSGSADQSSSNWTRREITCGTSEQYTKEA